MKTYDIKVRVTIDDEWRTEAEEEYGLNQLSGYVRRELHRRLAMHPKEKVELIGWERVSSFTDKLIDALPGVHRI